MEKKLINSSQAHKLMILAGVDMSYPTAIKWMMERGLAVQPTGPRGGIIVDEVKLNAEIRNLLKKGKQ